MKFLCLRTLLSVFFFALVTQTVVAQQITRDDLSDIDAARVQTVTRPTIDFDKVEKFEVMQGGATTSTHTVNRDAFSHSAANLSFEEEKKFKLGNGLFRKLWVASPSSTAASDGLGPLYNARSCQRCHLKDGRGHPPQNANDSAVSMFLRLSILPQNDVDRQAIASGEAALIAEPAYGTQLQDLAITGVKPEAKMGIRYTEMPITLNGGEIVNLREPTYSILNPAYGALHKDVLMSPRVAPPMIGLGLLQAIHPADILDNERQQAEAADDISGKVSWIGPGKENLEKIGRFGWKASMESVIAQSSGAFVGDLGISTDLDLRPFGDCTARQKDCLDQRHGVQKRLGASEAPSPVLDLVSFYASNLAPPARRQVDDPEILAGKKAFYDMGCATCHRPKYVTSRNAAQDGHRFQLIWPYTDFLLHDMGVGLSDNRPVGSASGQEWKTPPLWGIGLTEVVNGHTFFLHDGRARNLTEAILWHGGEAEGSKMRFVQLPLEVRENLLRFLNSL